MIYTTIAENPSQLFALKVAFHVHRTIVAGFIELGVLESTVEIDNHFNAPQNETSAINDSFHLIQSTQSFVESVCHDISFVNLSLLTPGCIVAQVS